MSTAHDTVQPGHADLPDFTGGVDLFLHIAGRVRQLARPPVRAALWHQVERGALDFAGLTAVMGAVSGFFAIATVEVGFGLGVTLGVRVFQALVLGQLAGFVCALLLIAGPGTAAMVELGLMRHQGELRTLQLIGIDPRDLLVLPRVVGFAFALFVLTFVFQAAAILGGFALAALFTRVSFTQQLVALSATLEPSALVISAARDLVLGAAIGMLVCTQGLVAPFSPARMPRIASQLLSRSLVVLVVVQGGTSLLFRS
jgi:ABC-type transporter Mla maintaining outer membrane lipid asymmetry permease subunit MlaE